MNKQIFANSLKALISLMIILGISLAIGKMYRKYQIAQVKAGFSELGQVMPRNFKYFVKEIEGQRKFDPQKLQAFIQYYEKMVELLPKKADAHGILGFCYYYAGKKEQAIEQYKQALAINPHFFWFHYNLASIYFEQEQYADAIDLYKKGLNDTLDSALLFIRFSQKIYQPLLGIRSDYTDDFLSREIEQDKEKAYRFIVRGHAALKQYDQVISISNYAVTLYKDKENQEFYYYHMGWAFLQMKDYEKAFYFFQKVIALNPENADVLYLLGLTAKGLGREDVAFRYIASSQYLHRDKKAKSIVFNSVRLRGF